MRDKRTPKDVCGEANIAVVWAVFILYRISFCVGTKTIPGIGLLFTHKNGDFGLISAVTERSCPAPISKMERHIAERCCVTLKCGVDRYSDRSGSE